MINVSNNFKNKLKSKAITSRTNILILGENQLIPSKDIISVKLKDYCNDSGTIVGTAMSKEIEVELYNNGQYDLANKEISFEYSLEVSSNSYENVKYGNFIIQEIEDITSENKLRFVAYDYMIKLNETKDISTFGYGSTYTLWHFYEDICDMYDIEYLDQEDDLPNTDFIVKEQPGFEDADGREIISRIAEMFGSFAKFNRDNKLGFFLSNDTDEVIEYSDMNTELQLNPSNDDVNTVVLELGNGVEGENVTKSLLKYVPHLDVNPNTGLLTQTQVQEEIVSIVISGNPFIYTEALRKLAIDGIFNRVYGFKYKSVSFGYIGRFYLDCGDKIKVVDKNGIVHETVVMNQYYEIPSTIKSTMNSDSLTINERKYLYEDSNTKKIKHTELVVDKLNGQIQSIVEEQDEQSQKLSTITQTVDEISIKVEDLEDLTETTRSRIGTKLCNLTPKKALEGEVVKMSVKSVNVSTGEFSKKGMFVNNRYFWWYTSSIYYDVEGIFEQGSFNLSTGENDDSYTGVLRTKDFLIIPDKVSAIQMWQSNDFGASIMPIYMCFYDANKNLINYSNGSFEMQTATVYRYYEVPSNAKYYRFNVMTYTYDPETKTYTWDAGKESGIVLTVDDYVNSKIRHRDGIKYNFKNCGMSRGLYYVKTSDGRDIYDELIYDFSADVENGYPKCYAIYRTELDEYGIPYELASEYKEVINIPTMQLFADINQLYFSDKVDDVETFGFIDLTYVKKNEFTENFATNYNVVAEINASIKDGRGVISLTGNDVVITSDNFKVTGDGKVVAQSGNIGGLTLANNGLYKQYKSDGVDKKSGLNIPETTSGATIFMYAGNNVSSNNLADSNMFVTHAGTQVFRSGSLQMIYPPTLYEDGTASWQSAMTFQDAGYNRYLSNGNRWAYHGITYRDGGASSESTWLYDSPAYEIFDGVHNSRIFDIYRFRPEASGDVPEKHGNVSTLVADFRINGSRDDREYWMYIQGKKVEVQSSDKRLKENIKDSDCNALDKINKIKIRSFDWRKDKKLLDGGKHVKFGFIAQEVEKIDDSLIIYNDEFDTYQMNTLNLLGLSYKAIQELSEENTKLKNTILSLEERLAKLEAKLGG